ncbi:dihydropteroate synthase [Helicobacter sp. 11S03491-1]|uniref:dihydropteroate synthase n=1 Tax=Helicobacter sp. 11S03491-1 TaxID=1476196 RepID=UPI000BA70672|nr:dihydropteroate synthase [Helicobacter sp. 11S03491-1]PAF42223.1 dihydropteroate synthase [Helicobacter sp. 11S03491-1]
MFVKRIQSQSLPQAIQKIGSDSSGAKIMNKKGEILTFEIKNLSLPATMILKQEAISVGGDFATHKECILAKKSHYDGVLIGTKIQIERIVAKCKIQPFNLKELADTLCGHLKNSFSCSPQIMAIINITPDSFFDQSRCDSQEAIKKIYSFIEKGVKFIDIGAASSRPGSELIESFEEIKRLREVIKEIYVSNLFKEAIFSIDTYNPQTADFALSYGFGMVNDISGYKHPDMAKITSQYKAKAVLMHSRGTPKDMQQFIDYENLFAHLDEFFEQKIQYLKSYGIDDITLDVGFGFAKEKSQNLSLIKHLGHFLHFGYPLLIGASRKHTIGLITQKEVSDRMAGTLALHLMAIENGAQILRVHDVEEHLDMLRVYEALKKNDE